MFIVPMSRLEPVLGVSGGAQEQDGRRPASGVPFAQLLSDSIEQLQQAQQAADQDSIDLALGTGEADLHTIMINSAILDNAVKTTVQLTSRAVTSYKEIMQMQV